ncbi:RNA polymerase-associated protein RapA [Frateuria aurantia]
MFVPGQRWISSAEPELGLGTILRVEGRSVQVLFAKAGILRPYAADSAPLIRAEFRAGQRVAGKGIAFLVERVEIKDDLLIYRGEGRELHEGQLDDEQSVSQADDRLVGGRVDTTAQFELRLETLQRRAEARRASNWGLASARIGLIPHQLRVAGIAASRRPPRVLLADEVGLGKTIEAGMIMARQLATGRASRVLVLLPDPLVYQWFVELRRRFNLNFAIYDEERCEALELADEDANPFEDDQLVITDFSVLEQHPKRAEQLLAAGWDLLVVDEAHHLAWSPEQASPRYQMVEQLAQRTPGVILLTATPEQLGRAGHFARLRLLDPDRYPELARYEAEADGYLALSAIADALSTGQPLSADQAAELQAQLGADAELQDALREPEKPAHAHALIAALIDRHGTGRAMFRHRRQSVGGFPQREPIVTMLDASRLDAGQIQSWLQEFQADLQTHPADADYDYSHDPRLDALISLLETHPQDKFLLICRTQAKVMALEEALRVRSGVGVARFHEGLSMVQRDRNAAFFAQPDGARLLLCSEIGSEGRNFQFAHRLVMWDLPIDPDLLEQRIGRLDRIGQKHSISLHLILAENSPQHLLAQWYDRGMDAFRHSPADGRQLLAEFGDEVAGAALAQDPKRIDTLIQETHALHQVLLAQVQAGRDHLLELAANRDLHADDLQRAFQHDSDPAQEAFMQRLFEQFGVHPEELSAGIWLLDPQYLSTDALPGFEEGPLSVTFDRATALARDDLPLLRLDHPLVGGAMELTLSGEQGNAAFLVDDLLPARSALLQAVFVVECVADRRLDADRYLPPTPVVVTVDTRLVEREAFIPSAVSVRKAADRSIEVPRYRKFLAKLVPPMLERAEALAGTQADQLKETALQLATTELDAELQRLLALRQVNPSVSEREISELVAERTQLLEALPQARLRLDAIRFVTSPDFLNLR